MEVAFLVEIAPGLPGADDVSGVVMVALVEPMGFGAHGRIADDPLVLDGEHVRALQHEDIRVGMAVYHPVEAPVLHVLGGVHPDLSALFDVADPEDHIPAIALLPDLGVAEMKDAVIRAWHNHALLLEVDSIIGNGHALFLEVALVLVHPVAPAMARVVDDHPAVIGQDRGSGEDPVLLGFEGGCHGQGLAPPGHQVLTGYVTPVHESPLGSIGVELVVGLVAALEEDQTVRVVDPARLGCDVAKWVPAIIAMLEEFVDAGLGLFQLGGHVGLFVCVLVHP